MQEIREYFMDFSYPGTTAKEPLGPDCEPLSQLVSVACEMNYVYQTIMKRSDDIKITRSFWVRGYDGDENPLPGQQPLLVPRSSVDTLIHAGVDAPFRTRVSDQVAVLYQESLWGSQVPVSGVLDVLYNKNLRHLLLG